MNGKMNNTLNIYEELLDEAVDNNILVKEVALKSKSDGLYKDGKIAINKNTLNTIAEKACILAEELGHHYKTYGNIIDLNNIDNMKQENKARNFAYDKLVGVSGIVKAYLKGCRNISEIADYLNVTELFLRDAIGYYSNKYGDRPVSYENYKIIFVPTLIIFKNI